MNCCWRERWTPMSSHESSSGYPRTEFLSTTECKYECYYLRPFTCEFVPDEVMV